MNNPAASGRGIKTDLLVREKPTAQGFKIPPQSSGEFTPPRLKNNLKTLKIEINPE
jgi:hypothetical protein